MRRYDVAFDGQWQGKFECQQDAEDWAEDVAASGRLVFVVEKGLLRSSLVAVYPADREEEGHYRWNNRVGVDSGGIASGMPL